MYYAHSTESANKEDWQPLLTHLTEVAELTSRFASRFHMQEWGYITGLIHDLGKYSQDFQRRLEGSSKRVDHATAGAKEIYKAWPKQPMATILSYIIAGHHSGLPDFGTASGADSCLARRLDKDLRKYDDAFEEITISQMPGHFSLQRGISIPFQYSFLTRMLFSCLVDADSLNTEEFADPAKFQQRAMDVDFNVLLHRFHDYVEKRFATPRDPVDYRRTEIFKECIERAHLAQGLYSLTLPTGSGKTIVSLGFALEHAVHHELRRIVYVIPYTSIIEQNAAIFREVLGEDVVLEHHSNVQQEADESDEEVEDEASLRRIRNLRRLSEENWDMPVIVTTNVQFFESLFSNKRSKSRKIHNLAGSVIVLDEAQMMNGGFFKPCMYALEELARNYGCTVVMCTATQPPAAGVLNVSRAKSEIIIQEIVPDAELRYKQFERVRVVNRGIMNLPALAEEISALTQALCIVNTRKTARELYEALLQLGVKQAQDSKEGVYHLSARMCPKHRLDILRIVRKRLDDGLPCLLVSTQLIEAGVDVDFPAIYRELAGLDSIAQAAGRCNRNGRLTQGQMHVFESERGLPPGWMNLTGTLARSILIRCAEEGSDPLSLAVVQDYFAELSSFQQMGSADSTDSKDILARLEKEGNRLSFPFAEIGRDFRMIDEQMESIIIPYLTQEERAQGIDEDKSTIFCLLERIRFAPQLSRELLRQLQPYTVQLYYYEYKAYILAGELNEIREGIRVLQRPQAWYDLQTGIKPYSAECAAREIYIL